MAAVPAFIFHAPAAAQELPQWGLVEDVRFVDPDGGAPVLTTIGHFLPLPDGRTVVTQRVDNELWLFDSDGVFRQRFGGRGEGPGEFRSLSYATVIADSVWVVDPILRRATGLPLDGGSARTEPLPSLAVAPGARHRFRLANGSYLAYAELALRPDGPLVQENPLLLLAADGTRLDTMAVLPDMPLLGRFQIDGRSVSTPLRIPAPTGRWAAAPDGERFVTVQPGPPSEAPRTMLVRMFAASGQELWRRLLPYPEAARLSEAERAAATAGLADRLAQRGVDRRTAERLAAELEVPAIGPPAQWVWVGTDGRVWLQLDGGGTHIPASTWLVLDPDGRPEASVAVPARVYPWAAGPGVVWAAVYDEFDSPTLVRYRIGA